LPLNKFEEEKSDNTVKLCLSNLTCYNAITRVNTPSYHTTRLNLDDSMTLNLFLPSPNVLLLNHCKHYYRWWE